MKPSDVGMIILFSAIMVAVSMIAWIFLKKEREGKQKEIEKKKVIQEKSSTMAVHTIEDKSQEPFPSKCPYCRGEIERGVLKCKHCGEWLDKEQRNKEEQIKNAQIQTAQNTKSIRVAIAFLILIVFVLPILLKTCS